MMKPSFFFVAFIASTGTSAANNTTGANPGSQEDPSGNQCVRDGGYKWCQSLGECLRPWETPCPGLYIHEGTLAAGTDVGGGAANLDIPTGCLDNGSFNCLLVIEDESPEYYEYIVNPKNDPTVCNCICNQDHPCPGDMFVANYPIFVGSEKVGTHIQTATFVPFSSSSNGNLVAQAIFHSVFDLNSNSVSHGTITATGSMSTIEAVTGGTQSFQDVITGTVEYYDIESTAGGNNLTHYAAISYKTLG